MGIHGDLVLSDEASEAGDFGDAGHGLKVVADHPVLQGAEVRERVFSAAVDQRVLEDPSDAGRVGPELRRDTCRKPGLDLGEVLERPAARPVEIRPFLEDDVDVRETEVGQAADRLHTRSAEQCRHDRVGDLVLDDVGASVPARIDDHLRVGEVGKGVQRDA
jgi:hypothetical protein